MEGHVTTRRKFLPHDLNKAIKEVMGRRFNNDFNVHFDGVWWVVGGFPEGKHDEHYDYHTFTIENESTSRLFFKSQSKFSFWLMLIFMNELALKYNGWVRYGEGPEQPNTSKFPTFASFYEQFLKQYDKNDTDDGFYRHIFEELYRDSEKDARAFRAIPVATPQEEVSG